MPDHPPRPRASSAAWWALAALIVAYTVSYIDRTMLSLLVQPIRAALRISDVQFSLLQGLAFALFYTVLGIPLARIADRANRRNLIIAGAALWSVATTLCGIAQNFGQLFAARLGVGIGEASLSPAAYSLIGDAFPKAQLPQALSIYSMAIYLGSGFALVGGGAAIAAMPAISLPIIGHLAPWQAVFPFMGLMGIVVIALMATVVEPARTGPAATPTVSEVVRLIAGHARCYGSVFLGYGAGGCVWSGTMAWLPSVFIRQFQWTSGQTGIRFGLAVLAFAPAGILLGGRLATFWRRRGIAAANLAVGVLSAILASGAALLLPLVRATPAGTFAVVCAFLFLGAAPYGAAVAALHEITPGRMRAQISAIYLFAINAAGIGAGPTLVALYARHFTAAPLASGIALNAAIGGTLGAVLLGQSLAPYRRALAQA